LNKSNQKEEGDEAIKKSNLHNCNILKY
jgi:hypothetical protein